MTLDPDLRARLAGRTMILGVGAQKCGTSWMFDYLAADPAIYAPPLKELHFFDAWLRPDLCAGYDARFRRLLTRTDTPLGRIVERRKVKALRERVAMIEDRDAYLRFFASRIGEQAFMTEFSPCYSLIEPEGFVRIRDYFDDAGVTVKPVFLMRDPVERLYSAARMQVRDNDDDARHIFSHFLEKYSARARGHYHQTIVGLWHAFGRDGVSITFYENLFDDPDLWLRRITDFAGVEYRAPNLDRKVNASPRKADLTQGQVETALNRYSKVYAFINKHFPTEKPSSWHQ